MTVRSAERTPRQLRSLMLGGRRIFFSVEQGRVVPQGMNLEDEELGASLSGTRVHAAVMICRVIEECYQQLSWKMPPEQFLQLCYSIFALGDSRKRLEQGQPIWLARRATSSMERRRRDVARSQRAPGRVLDWLSHDQAEWVRMDVASDKTTPPATLARLAFDSSPRVRMEAARHRSLPPEVQPHLARGEAQIAFALAQNPSLSAQASRVLFNIHSEGGLMVELASNHSTAPDVLFDLSRIESSLIQTRLASHPKSPVELLVRLSKSSNPQIRIAVAGNPGTPVEVLERMQLTEPDWSVHQALSRNLNERLAAAGPAL